MIPVPMLADPFDSLDQGQIFVVVLTAIGCGTGLLISVGGMVAGVIGAVHRRKVEADLKRDMLDRGMSAEEIATVIGAASPSEDPVGRWVDSWCKKK